MSLFNVIKHCLKETYRAVSAKQEMAINEFKIAKKQNQKNNTAH